MQQGGQRHRDCLAPRYPERRPSPGPTVRSAVDPFYEKSGWTEDVFVAAQSIMYNFHTARLFNEWLADIRDSQLPNGQIPIIIPSPGWGYTRWGTPSPIWTAVYPIMLWRMYENYSDRPLVEEHYPAVKRYLDRELQNLSDGLVTKEFLGDWVAPGYSVPPEDTRLAASAYVYRSRGNHLNTGAVGTEVILPVLTENGYPELANAIANQTTYPSWGYWYANGADTMWESWDLNTRSRSHFFLGIVDEWLYRYHAGIKPGAPGYKQIVVRPHPQVGPAAAEARFRSVHGEVRSEWKRHGNKFTLRVTVPVNTTAVVYVPIDGSAVHVHVSGDGARFRRQENGYAVYEAGSGHYVFRSKMPR